MDTNSFHKWFKKKDKGFFYEKKDHEIIFSFIKIELREDGK